MTKPVELIAYLFDGQPNSISPGLMEWMEASPRFTAFVDTYRDKIRKKIRIVREPESLLDLVGELEVAYCLLKDRRLSVAYEPYASEKRRGPDFSVAYRINLLFNVEVARIRVEPNEQVQTDLTRKEERILHILLDKLGQMQAGMPNLLVIHTREELRQSIDLDRLMQVVKTRAEKKDPEFYAISRYAGPADFYKEFTRLSAILMWGPEAQPWTNKQARPRLAEKAMRLVSSLSERD